MRVEARHQVKQKKKEDEAVLMNQQQIRVPKKMAEEELLWCQGKIIQIKTIQQKRERERMKNKKKYFKNFLLSSFKTQYLFRSFPDGLNISPMQLNNTSPDLKMLIKNLWTIQLLLLYHIPIHVNRWS